MRLAVLAFLAGEALSLTGLWLAWAPLALIVGGAQLVALGLLIEGRDDS